MKWPWSKKPVEDSEEKLNPGQRTIYDHEGGSIYSREDTFNYRQQYESIEVVNRAVNMIVDDAALIPCKIGETLKGATPVSKGVRAATVDRLLNVEPNLFQDINSFRRNILTDLIIDGNAFIYFDGAHLYHLPANKMVINPDPKTYISHFTFNGELEYLPSEIIHIKENSFYSIYRGVSRLKPASRSMKLLVSMRKFQENFFKNGAVPGLVLKTPNTLSERIKERLLESWALRYNPENGGRRPLILDGGLEIDSISSVNFKELDFQSAIEVCEHTVLKAIGVPPILFDGGNNANITPNLRLYYLETVLPLVRKINIAYGRFFGYTIWDNLIDIEALQKDLREQAGYFSTLVNGGILTPNEARLDLGREARTDCEGIRVPANIAGSAVNPNDGGRPSEGDE